MTPRRLPGSGNHLPTCEQWCPTMHCRCGAEAMPGVQHCPDHVPTKGGSGPRPADYAPPTQPVAMWINSGGTPQRVERVIQVSFATGRVLLTCYPDLTPRWVSLLKPRTTPDIPNHRGLERPEREGSQ